MTAAPLVHWAGAPETVCPKAGPVSLKAVSVTCSICLARVRLAAEGRRLTQGRS